MGEPLELGADHAIFTPPVDESREVETEVTQAGAEMGTIVVTVENDPVPQMFLAQTLNLYEAPAVIPELMVYEVDVYADVSPNTSVHELVP